MKICVAGEGAQGLTHLEALQSIENVEVQSLAGGIAADAETFATEWNIARQTKYTANKLLPRWKRGNTCL